MLELTKPINAGHKIPVTIYFNNYIYIILFIYSEMLLNSVVEVKVKILKIIEMMQRAALLS